MYGSGTSRGFGSVIFENGESATLALEELHLREMPSGGQRYVGRRGDSSTIYVENIPPNTSELQVKKILLTLSPGVKRVTLMNTEAAACPGVHAFVEYTLPSLAEKALCKIRAEGGSLWKEQMSLDFDRKSEMISESAPRKTCAAQNDDTGNKNEGAQENRLPVSNEGLHTEISSKNTENLENRIQYAQEKVFRTRIIYPSKITERPKNRFQVTQACRLSDKITHTSRPIVEPSNSKESPEEWIQGAQDSRLSNKTISTMIFYRSRENENPEKRIQGTQDYRNPKKQSRYKKFVPPRLCPNINNTQHDRNTLTASNEVVVNETSIPPCGKHYIKEHNKPDGVPFKQYELFPAPNSERSNVNGTSKYSEIPNEDSFVSWLARIVKSTRD